MPMSEFYKLSQFQFKVSDEEMDGSKVVSGRNTAKSSLALRGPRILLMGVLSLK